MKITLQWLDKKQACGDAIKLFQQQNETDSEKILQILIDQKKYSWANWLIVRLMNYRQHISYADFLSEQVIDSVDAENVETYLKILHYGINLLKKGEQ